MKQAQLLNPGPGLGTKGSLRSLKAPLARPISFHLSLTQSGSYSKQEEKRGKEGNKMPIPKGADIILFIRAQKQGHSLLPLTAALQLFL